MRVDAAGQPAVEPRLVSIITPTLNQARYLQQTLRSVGAQTYAHVEHLVVDGGSIDGTLDVLRGWQDPRLTWTTEPDQGMYEAINRGLGMAHGEVLAYLNSDDLYYPWTIEAAVEAFERDASIDLVYGDALRLDEPSGSLIPWLQPPTSVRTTLAAGSFVQPTVFWRKRVSDELGGFDPALRLAGDLDFWFRAANSGYRFQRLDEFLAIDRAHPLTQSVSRSAALTEETVAVRARHPEQGSQRRARLRVRMSRRMLWARLVWAVLRRRSAGGPWSRSIEQLHPRVSMVGLGASLFRGSTASSSPLTWLIDPHQVASGGAHGLPERSDDRR